jgi:hypothetical protein
MTPLHAIGDFLRGLFAAIPLPVVRGFFLAVPLLLLIWVLRLPRSATTAPAGGGRWDENLKVWASIALLIQAALYALL